MIYFRINGDSMIKYEVQYDSAKLVALMKEIIDNCGSYDKPYTLNYVSYGDEQKVPELARLIDSFIKGNAKSLLDYLLGDTQIKEKETEEDRLLSNKISKYEELRKALSDPDNINYVIVGGLLDEIKKLDDMLLEERIKHGHINHQSDYIKKLQSIIRINELSRVGYSVYKPVKVISKKAKIKKQSKRLRMF